MYAEIKHQPDAARTFWFVAPPELQHGIQEGDRVEVQTRHGKKGGIVVQLTDYSGYPECFQKVLKILQQESHPDVQNVRLEDLL